MKNLKISIQFVLFLITMLSGMYLISCTNSSMVDPSYPNEASVQKMINDGYTYFEGVLKIYIDKNYPKNEKLFQRYIKDNFLKHINDTLYVPVKLRNMSVKFSDGKILRTNNEGFIKGKFYGQDLKVKGIKEFHDLKEIENNGIKKYVLNLTFREMSCCSENPKLKKALLPPPVCIDYNGPIGDGANYPHESIGGIINFIGSDCFIATIMGYCVNEYMEEHEGERISCYENHNGMVCTKFLYQ